MHRDKFPTSSLRSAAMVMALFAAAGCGDGKSQRLAVAGKVLVDDQPLKAGAINFQPLGDGIGAGALITDGAYQVSRERGPTAGKYRVSITSPQPTGRKVRGAERGGRGLTDEAVEALPARYNVHSELQIDLNSDNASHVEFKLDPK